MADFPATVDLQIADHVAVVTINRPDARNAVDASVANGLAAALDEVESRPDVSVGILTGAGGNFCAGMDLKAFVRGEVVRLPDRGFAGVTQFVSRKPWIAALEGYALAGGFEIALWADLIVATVDTKVGLPEVKRGLVANAGGLVRLPRQMPSRIAAELVLTGDIVPASQLQPFGIVNRLVAAGQALEEARQIALKIASNGPLAVAASKRVLQESIDWPRAEMFERQNEITLPVFASADAKEGASAFAEKRAPVWRGE
ncbi:enoyl-CoA hydratase [Tardibacter chloracetimidivorans]|uniref:Enoyl-CoA hydratase n=1 Tax=Tardibacter chloracetimidivorans TaxID=1921510 RepID=A0A1L3ZUN0_9SPHN|nr:crotonase/enoyl-CoA hydratase family protein [Tardibacter chloracetimidivorans]API59341.1 enoyl-CoA hydratase [Tardibacter chloracetimidivorans]